jgi:hypothetical protein
MLKNFKYISQNFALKVHKRNKKCTTIDYTTEFYENLLLIQRSNLMKLYQNKNIFLNPEFCVNTYKINSILDDKRLDLLISDKLTQSVSEAGIKSDSSFYNLFESFYENLKSNPDHPLSKELMDTMNKNTFLFSEDEKKRLEKLMKSGGTLEKNDKNNLPELDDEEMSDIEEEYPDDEDLEEKVKKKHMEENKEPEPLVTPELNGKKFIEHYAKLRMRDDHVKIYLDTGNKKVTIKSKYFKSKIKIVGLNDNQSEKILQAFNYVDKNRPNTILIHKRPVHFEKNFLEEDNEEYSPVNDKSKKKSSKKNWGEKNLKDVEEEGMSMSEKKLSKNKLESSDNLHSSNKNYYTSLLGREQIMKYCKEILAKNPEFKINSVERIVYEEKDSIKTMSYLQSLILKSNYALNINPQIKIILTDIPLYYEIENLMKDIFYKINPKDFFSYMKFSLLFERYLWLTENCGDRCPACDKDVKFDSIYYELNELVDDYLLAFKGIEHIKIKNISSKILKSIQFGDFKGNNILAFVEEKYFYQVIERLVKDINEICEGKDWDTIEKIFVQGDKSISKQQEENNFEFDYPLGDFEKLFNYFKNKTVQEQVENQLNNENSEEIFKLKNEYMNKLAICLNIYQNKKLFDQKSNNLLPEITSLKEDILSAVSDLYKLYNENLNFVDEINLWSNRKYDYKCYPNEILINRYLDKKDLSDKN